MNKIEPTLRFMSVFANLIKVEGVDYFGSGTDIAIKVVDGKADVVELSNVLVEGVQYPSACLKLFHNIEMLRSFAKNVPMDTSGWEFDDFMLKNSANFYLKLHLNTSSANITEKKGFGTFFTDNKGLLATLLNAPDAVHEFLKKLVKEDKDYSEIARVYKFDRSTLSSDYVFDDAMELFIKQNTDLYKPYFTI